MSDRPPTPEQPDLWGARSRDWVEIQESAAQPLWRALLNSLNVVPGTRLLDAGCGAGGAAVMARESGAVVSAFDASEGLLSVARARLPAADMKLGELENIPFPDAAFDVVLAVNSLQFTQHPAVAAKELMRVTAPGGKIGIAVWSQDSDQREVFAAILALFEHPPKGRGVFELSDPGEVEALFLGLSTVTHVMDCPFVYPNMEIALRGQMSAGPSQRVAQIFGREKVEATIRQALQPFRTPSGEIVLHNRFRVILVG